MQEELQPLIDRIQKEGIETAESKAQEIIEHAQKEASAILEHASAQAEIILEKADQDAQAFTLRSRKTLEHASRDVLISIGQAVDKVFSDLVKEAVAEGLDKSTLQEMLVKLAQSYGEANGRSSSIKVLLGNNEQGELASYLRGQLVEKLKRGVEIQAENNSYSGFKVSFSEGNVYHDFTLETISEAISAFLRPKLAEIVKRAAGLTQGGGEGG